jgi:hypothetical protein
MITFVSEIVDSHAPYPYTISRTKFILQKLGFAIALTLEVLKRSLIVSYLKVACTKLLKKHRNPDCKTIT